MCSMDIAVWVIERDEGKWTESDDGGGEEEAQEQSRG